MAIEKIVIERNAGKDMVKLSVIKTGSREEEILYVGHVTKLDVDEFVDTVKVLFLALYE